MPRPNRKVEGGEKNKMKKWYLIIDVANCENCNNCFLSCKDEYVGNNFPPYSVAQPRHGPRWMNIVSKERGRYPMVDVAYLPIPCMHCDNALCIKNGRDRAVYMRDDGIVIIDPEKAKGQREIVNACPYGSIWWNEEEKVAQKCTFCVHLLDTGWKEPRCVQACPTKALRSFRATGSEMQKIIESEKLEVLYPEYKTMPHVYYKNLYHFTRCFIGGSLAVSKEGKNECAEGIKIVLIKDSEKVGETLTDNYGDFKFDNLEENSGKYQLEIVTKGIEKKILDVDLKTSVCVGTLFL